MKKTLLFLLAIMAHLLSHGQAPCGNCNRTFSHPNNGNNGTITFTYPACATSVSITLNGNTTTVPVGPGAGSYTFTGLGAGVYYLSVAGNGNINGNCNGQVHLIDPGNPLLGITAPPDVVVNNDLGLCSASNINLGTPIVTGPGNLQNINVTNNAQVTYAVGSHTVTWTATLGANSVSATQNVLVIDNEAPNAQCKNYTLYLDVNGFGTVNASDIDNNSTDNCGILSMTVSPSTFTCQEVGDHDVILTVTDIHNNFASCTATVSVVYNTPACNIDVIPANNVYTGGIANNIYLGYGPQSATLAGSVAGGGNYTYSWSPATYLSCTNCASPIFTPTTAGTFTYTMTATNENGCTIECEVTMCVIDAKATGQGNNGKILLCHVPNGNNANPQLLALAPAAVNAHLTQHNADKLGPCNASCGNARGIAQEEISEEGLDMHIFPIPVSDELNITVESSLQEMATIVINDLTGRMIKQINNVTPHVPIAVNDKLHSGIYIIKATQLGETIIKKVIVK